VLNWLIQDLHPSVGVNPQWADLRRLHKPPRDLAERIALSLELYPCELMFVHRDAERVPFETRRAEIDTAIKLASEKGILAPALAVIPVRMQEAWLLSSDAAIRQASGNPSSKLPINIPDKSKWELLPNPKDLLIDLLKRASGASGRKLRKLDTSSMIHRVAELTRDFSPLRELKAFRELEHELMQTLPNLVRVAE